MDYGKAIRIVRAAFSLKQAELAERLEISPSHLSLLEAGKRQPSLRLLDDIAIALRIPRQLLTLLATEAQDLELQDQGQVQALAVSLLRMLAHATTEDQRHLPLSSKEK